MPINNQITAQLDISDFELLGYLNDDVREIFTTMVGMDVTSCSTMSKADSSFKNCVSAARLVVGR